MFVKRIPFYYGWVIVFMAAIAMTATLPGRTHGLGLITKPLIEDLEISETTYAQINLWTSLIGALFCFPMGLLIDRMGVRFTGTIVIGLLAVSVLGMANIQSSFALFVALLLIRGLGQSSLSIVSMSMIGKWFRGRLGSAMGRYAVLLTFGFIGSILGMGWGVERTGWRGAWQWLGWSLMALAPLHWLIVRSTPEACGVTSDEVSSSSSESHSQLRDYTVWQALRIPAFWVFALGTSAFNLIWSSITLFNESILAELGFEQRTAVEMMAFLTGVGLITNIVAGKLAKRERLGRLLGIGLVALAGALFLFPSIGSLTQLRFYGASMGFVGGMITVIHFAAWGQLFGRVHLGRIQAVAQAVSVLASALGPLLIAWCHASMNSYLPIYYFFAGCVLVIAIAAIFVPTPPLQSTLHSLSTQE